MVVQGKQLPANSRPPSVPVTHPNSLPSNGTEHRMSDTSDCSAIERQRPSNYDRFCKALENDPVVMKEISLGKRIGFYRLRKDLGAGNFSKVKMGTNSVTKGLFFTFSRIED